MAHPDHRPGHRSARWRAVARRRQTAPGPRRRGPGVSGRRGVGRLRRRRAAADEVIRLDTHLADCLACRRLVAMLAPEVSAAPRHPPRESRGAAAGERGGASVSPPAGVRVDGRGGRAACRRDAVVGLAARQRRARASAPADSSAPIAAPAPPRPACGVARSRPTSRRPPAAAPLDRLAATPAPDRRRCASAALAERAPDKADASAKKGRCASGRTRLRALAGVRGPWPQPAPLPRPAVRRLAGTAPSPSRGEANAQPRTPRPPPTLAHDPLQTNAVAAESPRARGPLANQASNASQQNAHLQPLRRRCTRRRRRHCRLRAERRRRRPRRARGDAGRRARAPARLTRARRRPRAARNEAAGRRGGLDDERVDAAVPLPATARRGPQPERVRRRRRVPSAIRRGAVAKDECAKSLGYVPRPRRGAGVRRAGWPPALAHCRRPPPRIVERRRHDVEARATARVRGDRLRAGTAPAIDSAWAVGERGLVLRLHGAGRLDARCRAAGDGDARSRCRPPARTSARVTAADGRVFETADGGATWTPATPGAGPPVSAARGRGPARRGLHPPGRARRAACAARPIRADDRAARRRRPHAGASRGPRRARRRRDPRRNRCARAIERVERGVAFARVEAVLTPSPDRRAAAFDPACGGGVYAHVDLARQVALKRDVILDGLRRGAGLAWDRPLDVAASPEHGYRLRARLHVRDGRVGFFREGTHVLCDAAPSAQLAAEHARRRAAPGRRARRAARRRRRPTASRSSENLDGSERAVHLHPIDRALASAERCRRRVAARCSSTASPASRWRRPAAARRPSPAIRRSATISWRLVRGAPPGIRLRRHAASFFQGNRFLVGALASRRRRRRARRRAGRGISMPASACSPSRCARPAAIASPPSKATP